MTDRERALDLEECWRTSSDIFLLLDRTGTIIDVNPAIVPTLGWSVAATQGRDIATLVHPDDCARMQDALTGLRAGVALGSLSLRLTREDGQYRQMNLRAGAVSTDGRFMVVARDVTLFQQTMRENFRLTHAYHFLRRASDVSRRAATREALFADACRCAVTDGNFRLAWIGMLDPVTGVLRAVATAGVGHDTPNGLPFSADPDGFGQAAREGRTVVFADFELDATPAPWRAAAIVYGLRSSASLPLTANGTIVGVLTVFAAEAGAFGDDEVILLGDVAAEISASLGALERREEQQRTEAAVRRLEAHQHRTQRLESVGTLAGGIAHDLNNTLAPIVMAVGLLERLPLDERASRHLKTIEKSAARGAAMVKQVLSFARGLEGEKVAMTVRHVVNDVAKMLDDTLLKDVRVEVVAPRELPSVMADPAQLHQVMLSLCVNAVQAMEGHGLLRIVAEEVTLEQAAALGIAGGRAGHFICISVTDTGPGIVPGVLDRIFEPFFTTKAAGQGTGLGLSTSLGIVRSHNGFIGVESIVGRGSMFRVYLPVVEESAEPAAPRTFVGTPEGHGELVLVVEDEDDVRELVRETLEQFHFRVLTARDGAEGVALFARDGNDIAVVLTDIKMPVLDGIAMTHAIRRLRPNVRVVAMSGVDASLADAERLVHESVTRVMQKPFEVATLVRTVREALDAPLPATAAMHSNPPTGAPPIRGDQ
ncbi:MAG: response regulator [Gemmatimonadetes bacterium]|nr:response regulator [Gemmatimonadota bacterium]